MSYVYRLAILPDSLKLSVLLKQVYIDTYGREGVSDEFANFITAQFSAERLQSQIQSTAHEIWVATHKNNLIGALRVDYDKTAPLGDLCAAEINKLYILKPFLGKGISQNLIQKAEEQLEAQGEKQIWLWVLGSNKRAIQFYQKQGYSIVGEAPFQMEENIYNNFVMLKQL